MKCQNCLQQQEMEPIVNLAESEVVLGWWCPRCGAKILYGDTVVSKIREDEA